MAKENPRFTRFDINPETGEKKYNWEEASERSPSSTARLAKFGLQKVWKENLGRMFGEVMKIKEGGDYKGCSRFGDLSCSEFALAVIHKKGLSRAIPLIRERMRRCGPRHFKDLGSQKRRELEKTAPETGMPVPWKNLWESLTEGDIHINPYRRALALSLLAPVFPMTNAGCGKSKTLEDCHSSTAKMIEKFGGATVYLPTRKGSFLGDRHVIGVIKATKTIKEKDFWGRTTEVPVENIYVSCGSDDDTLGLKAYGSVEEALEDQFDPRARRRLESYVVRDVEEFKEMLDDRGLLS